MRRGLSRGCPALGRLGAGAVPERSGPRQPLSRCVAGERLCSTEEATAGSGTYTRHGFIFSSLAGCLERKNEDNEVRRGRGTAAPRQGCVLCTQAARPPWRLGCGGELDSDGVRLVVLCTSCALC